MARGPRITYPNAIFHVFNRFVDKHPFFEKDDDYECFLNTYFETAAVCKVRTFAYCLMPNHFHFCLQTPDGAISRFLQKFLTRAVQKINRRYERSGHLLEGRTKTLLIEDQRYFDTVIGYVLLNPVRAGLCSDPWLYPHSFSQEILRSSCRIDRRALIDKITGHWVSIDDEVEQMRAFQEWSKMLDLESNERVFKENTRGAFLSSEEFRKRLLDENERRVRLEEKRARRVADRDRWQSWDEIRRVARTVFESAPIARQFWRTATIAENEIAVYIAHEIAGWSFDRIREEDNDKNGSSCYRMAASRIRNNPGKLKLIGVTPSFCHNDKMTE